MDSPGMRSHRIVRLRIFALLGAVLLAGGFSLLLNVGGWRARLVARLLRVDNYPVLVPPPAGFLPKAPLGFKVSIFAKDFAQPRWLATAPNGDIFVADSAAGQVIVLKEDRATGAATARTIFSDHLNLPFGVAFHENFVYVACTNEVVRFRFDPASSQPTGKAEHILDLPGMGYHQHWTRSIAFSKDGTQMFVSIGSETNVSIESDPRRAAIIASDPDGKHSHIYASGMRNVVGIAISPDTDALWATVNERDDIGDDLPPDYFTHVREGGFYGWPYSYIGPHLDPRVSQRPDLVARAIVPDVLLEAHAAPLQLLFYEGQQFPASYRHGAFIAEHGSWNRRLRSGYKVIFVPCHDGVPAGPPVTFLSGFVPDPAGKDVYGRPAGLAVQADGSLLVSDDAAKLIWRVTYQQTPR